jgi:DNA-binding transcriptional ArsR family regulator
MKRDPDLIREILLRTEALPIGHFLSNIEIDGYSPDIIGEHVRLLEEAEFIDAQIARSQSQMGVTIVGSYAINRLLNDGHDFIENAKSDTVWKRAREQVAEKTGDVSLTVLKAVLAKTAMQVLGL